MASSVAPEPKSIAGISPRRIGLGAIEIAGDDQVQAPVAVDISGDDPLDRRDLRQRRQRRCRKAAASVVVQEHAREGVCLIV